MAVPAFSAYQRFLIFILAVLQFTVVLDFMVLAPLGATLLPSLGITTRQFSLVVSAYAFSAGAAGILTAGFADRFDRKQLLLFFYSGFILGTLGCALATQYAWLLAARTVTGLFGGVINSVLLAIIADEFAPQQRGRAVGLVQMAFSVSQVLGIPAGLYLAARWSWHAPFYLLIGLGILVGAAVVLGIRPVVAHLALRHRGSPLAHLWQTLRNPHNQAGFLATALLSIGGFMLMPFGSTFLQYNLHVAPQQLPLVYLCTGMATMLGLPLVGRLSDRVSRFRLLLTSVVLSSVMVVVYTNQVPSPLWVIIGINIVLFLTIMSRMVPATALTTSLPDPADRGAYMSITAALQQVAGGLAAVVAGLIITQASETSPLQHYNVLGGLAVVSSCLCALLMYRVSVLVARKQAAVPVVAEPLVAAPALQE